MNDRERFIEIYSAHYRPVYAYCQRRLAADLVEDAVAETFLAVWRKIDELPEGEESLPWLYGVAYRVLMHQWRTSYRIGRLSKRLYSLGVEPPTLPEEFILASHESRRVHEAASRLNKTDQEILRLSLWEDMSHADIASVLDLKVEAVRQRFSRALKKLTKEFNRLEGKRGPTPAAQKGGVL